MPVSYVVPRKKKTRCAVHLTWNTQLTPALANGFGQLNPRNLSISVATVAAQTPFESQKNRFESNVLITNNSAATISTLIDRYPNSTVGVINSQNAPANTGSFVSTTVLTWLDGYQAANAGNMDFSVCFNNVVTSLWAHLLNAGQVNQARALLSNALDPSDAATLLPFTSVSQLTGTPGALVAMAVNEMAFQYVRESPYKAVYIADLEWVPTLGRALGQLIDYVRQVSGKDCGILRTTAGYDSYTVEQFTANDFEEIMQVAVDKGVHGFVVHGTDLIGADGNLNTFGTVFKKYAGW